MKKNISPLYEQIFETQAWKKFSESKTFNGHLHLVELNKVLSDVRKEITGNKASHPAFIRFESYLHNLLQIVSRKKKFDTVQALASLEYPKGHIKTYKGILSDHNTLLKLLTPILENTKHREKVLEKENSISNPALFTWHPFKKEVKKV